MYQAPQHYRALAMASRIEAATPHQLVTILYEELLGALDVARTALLQGRGDTCRSARGRAVSILLALELSLDFDLGGDLARRLAAIYRGIQQKLSATTEELDAATLQEARKSVESLHAAWVRIALPAAA